MNHLLGELHINPILRAALLIVIGFFVARLVSMSLNKALSRRLTAQQAMLTRRITYYLILLLFVASTIQELGFHISALLGATGILTIAIGIASQTSLSNIISGIFIIGEKPFEIGDTIKVDQIQGEVIAIDFLSAKIRTSENTMVRIPNETLIKSLITNISYFPIRRAEIPIGVSFNSNLEKVERILAGIAEKNIYCLAEPKPSFLVLGFGDSALNLQFSVWSNREHFNDLKNSIQNEIIKKFEEYGIEMPFPSHSIYTHTNYAHEKK